MKISAIIPTYCRPNLLLRSLKSLQEQTLQDFEILVVDNAADLAVEHLVQEFNHSARVPAQYIPEPELGLHNARHAGSRAARGEVLVFTDDDATFDPKWLEAYCSAFTAYPEMVAAGGPVRPIWDSPPPEWLLNFKSESKKFPILSLMEPYQDFVLSPHGEFYGVNMAIRRDLLFELGGFNPESFGDIWLGDGESGLNKKLWNQGMLVGYIPDAIVYHHIPPQRMTSRYFCRRMANEGASTEYSVLHEKKPKLPELGRRMASVSRQLLRQGLSNLKQVVLRQERVTVLKLVMDAAYNLSRLRYMFRWATKAQFRAMVSKKNWLVGTKAIQ